MKIRKFEVNDYNEVVSMFKDFVVTLYPNRKIGSDMAFNEAVLGWIKNKKHIFVTTTNDGVITGFTVSYVDYNSYLTEPVYFGETAYVKPMYRGGKSAYLLYNNAVIIAKDLGLLLSANAFINEHKVDTIQSKFGLVPNYINMEQRR